MKWADEKCQRFNYETPRNAKFYTVYYSANLDHVLYYSIMSSPTLNTSAQYSLLYYCSGQDNNSLVGSNIHQDMHQVVITT